MANEWVRLHVCGGMWGGMLRCHEMYVRSCRTHWIHGSASFHRYRHLVDGFSIDPDRIVLAGDSSGGGSVLSALLEMVANEVTKLPIYSSCLSENRDYHYL